jgi:3-methyladenine DNA glycosylase/8-oxoguanine DNA glycosylase
MTASYHRGTLMQVWNEVHSLAEQILQAGFDVVRIKIEAMTYNQDIPVEDWEVSHHPASNYFEFHIKALLPADTDLQALEQQCSEQGAHLSANALKQMAKGYHQRFITLRLYGLGRKSAQARFETLITSLRSQQIQLVQPQQEYTVYDSNLQLDAGWLALPLDQPPGGETDDKS